MVNGEWPSVFSLNTYKQGGIEMSLYTIFAVILTGVVALFSVQNAQPVKVSFLKWYFEGSLVIVLLLTFAAGLVSAALFAIPARFRKARELADCRSRVRQLEGEPAKEKVPPAGGTESTLDE
jgi:lipopolysaccharide assembly protein A